MDPADVINPTSTRDAALARVLAYRQRVRARPLLIRATLAMVGGGLFVVSLPMIVLLPELGIPALLVAFRLLASRRSGLCAPTPGPTGDSPSCESGSIARYWLPARLSWLVCSWRPSLSSGYSFTSSSPSGSRSRHNGSSYAPEAACS